MMEAVLIDLLMRKGVLTESEALEVASIHALYSKLVAVGEVGPLSKNDEVIIKDIEKLKNRKMTLVSKLVHLRRMAFQTNNPFLKGLILKTFEKAKKVSDG